MSRSVPKHVGIAAAVVLTAVVGLTLFYVVGPGAGRATDGPLGTPNPHGWAMSEQVGDPFTDGMEILRLDGDEPAVIEDIRLVGDPGLELVGAMLAPPGRGIGAIQYSPSFPPKNDPDLGDIALVDAVGTTITPLSQDSAGWELLLGIEASREGYLVRRAVEIDYRVGGSDYTVVLPANLAVCTSTEHEVDGECPAPEL